MCSVGYMLHINHNGDYWPCPIFPFKLGNLSCDSIEEVFNTKTMKNLRNRIQIIEGKCKKCSHLSLCGGGCRALAFINGGNLNASDETCWHK
jgi:radical SAM protein with 4Fe4S-binding SPASM domain